MEISPYHVFLKPLLELELEKQILIKDIRNEDSVRKWMYNEHIISLNEHLAWIDKLKHDDKQLVFAVMDESHQLLGVFSFCNIEITHKTANWGFYLAPNALKGLGSALHYALLNFAFDIMKLEKLNSEVIEGNDLSYKLHKKFLFKDEGFRTNNVVKNNQRVGVHYIGLSKDDWYAGKDYLYNQYKDTFDKVLTSIHWQRTHPKRTAIDDITAARTKNNLNWMSILKLALEKSPNIAKPIVADIKNLDSQISALTNKLLQE